MILENAVDWLIDAVEWAEDDARLKSWTKKPPNKATRAFGKKADEFERTLGWLKENRELIDSAPGLKAENDALKVSNDEKHMVAVRLQRELSLVSESLESTMRNRDLDIIRLKSERDALLEAARLSKIAMDDLDEIGTAVRMQEKYHVNKGFITFFRPLDDDGEDRGILHSAGNCTSCHRHAYHGHAEDCKLAAAINATNAAIDKSHEQAQQPAPEPMCHILWREQATGEEGCVNDKERPAEFKQSVAQSECERLNREYPGINHWPELV